MPRSTMTPRKIVVPIAVRLCKNLSSMSLPLSDTRIGKRLQDIKNQIEHDKQHAYEKDIHLNHWVVTVENRLDAERAKPWPRKNIFDDDRARNELRNAHADGNKTCMQRIAQDMPDQNHTLPNAAHPCIFHIVLFHILQHIVANQTDICRYIRQCHGKSRQNQRIKPFVAARRQKVHLDGNEPHEQKANPVRRHRRRHKDKKANDLIEPSILVDRAEKANRQRDEDDKDERRPCKFQCRRQTAQQFVSNIPQRIDITEAEISMKDVPHPGEIANEIRLVKTELSSRLCNHLGTDDGNLANAQRHFRRIRGNETDESEADKRNCKEKRYRQQDSPNDILFHKITPLIINTMKKLSYLALYHLQNAGKDCHIFCDSPPDSRKAYFQLMSQKGTSYCEDVNWTPSRPSR